jgi:thioredoxin reductase (NADPH)
MARPIILAVHDDRDTLAEVEAALLERYATSYRVVCVPSVEEARALLAQPESAADNLALVLCGQWLSGGSTGTDLLDEVWSLHPRARRALLIDWGQWGQTPTGRAIHEGISRGCFDHYVVRPAASPDEMFHQAISTMLLDWAEATRAAPYTVHVVGESWSGRAYESARRCRRARCRTRSRWPTHPRAGRSSPRPARTWSCR